MPITITKVIDGVPTRICIELTDPPHVVIEFSKVVTENGLEVERSIQPPEDLGTFLTAIQKTTLRTIFQAAISTWKTVRFS